MWGCWSRAASLNLPLEPLRSQRGGQLGEQHLEGDRAVVLEVVGQIDGGHPAAPELALKRVAVVESLAERRGNVGQEGPSVMRDSPNLHGLRLKGQQMGSSTEDRGTLSIAT